MNIFKKILTATAFIAAAYFVLICPVAKAQSMTAAQKQALILEIQQEIGLLQQQLVIALAQQGTGYWCNTFNTDLGIANSGTNDVGNLHMALQQQGISYAPDDIDTYSNATSQAVVEFQARYGIEQTGYVGSITRAKLNALYGCVVTAPVSAAANNCTPNWQCGSWSSCYQGQEKRSCVDQNNCGSTASEPISTQLCASGACNSNSDCGSPNYIGNTFCQEGNVYQIYVTYTCNSPGTTTSTCTSGTSAQLRTVCTPGEKCTNGSCNCTPNWSCTGFGACTNGVQTQYCNDINSCGSAANEPSLAQSCTSSGSYSYSYSGQSTCTPNWQCGAWGPCYYTGQQFRQCIDQNSCGVETGLPAISQSCTP